MNAGIQPSRLAASRDERERLGQQLAELLDDRMSPWIALPAALRRRLFNALLQCPVWLLQQALAANGATDTHSL